MAMKYHRRRMAETKRLKLGVDDVIMAKENMITIYQQRNREKTTDALMVAARNVK